MEDLLIVRSSERIRPRLAQRRARTPLAANLGIVLGFAFGLIGASQFQEQPLIGLALGLAVGIAIGGILAPLLKPRTPRRPAFAKLHYTGFPFTDEDEPEKPAKS